MSTKATRKSLVSRLAIATLAVSAVGSAIGRSPDDTLASNGEVKITVAEYEASILRIPENDRFGWAQSQERINKEILNLIRIKLFANEARHLNLDDNPTIKTRVAQYAERLLSEALTAKVDADSAKEFEAQRASFLEHAREQYKVSKQQQQSAAEVRASHILINFRDRTHEEALAKANALRARVLAGESFESLAESESDDPTAKQNRGSLGYFGAGKMDPAFEIAAFALKKPGEISAPVQSRFGYHLIRIDDIKPARQLNFEEVSADLMEKIKAQYLGNQRELVLRKIYNPELIKWNDPAVVGLKTTINPAVYKIPPQ